MTIDPDEKEPESRAGASMLWGDSPALRNAAIVLMGLLLGVILYGVGTMAAAVGRKAADGWARLSEAVESVAVEPAPRRVEIDAIPPDLSDLPVARPQGDPATWFTTDDYPTEALRQGAQGTVAFGVEVDRSGRLARCFIVESSGSSVLDSATCALVRERGHFEPAVDPDGRRHRSRFQRRVRWQIPG
ncbi:MAG TPA: energy transducer TonB [Sphingomonas sp.]|nr:energy transducer TonB [Sphingomonas sp.]